MELSSAEDWSRANMTACIDPSGMYGHLVDAESTSTNLVDEDAMFAANQIRKIIRKQPESHVAKIFSGLIVSLESDEPIKFKDLYDMPFDDFKLAIEVIRDWRVERYYKSKMKVLDLSVHHQESAD